MYFFTFLRQGLSLDVRLLSVCYNTPLRQQNSSGGVVTGKIHLLIIV